MEEQVANELENRIRRLIAPMEVDIRVGFFTMLLGMAWETVTGRARRSIFRQWLGPDVLDDDIDFIVNAALSYEEGFRRVLQNLTDGAVEDDDAAADRRQNAQNAQDGTGGIPRNLQQENLRELRTVQSSESSLTYGSLSTVTVGLPLSADTSSGTADTSAGGTNPQID